MLKFHLVITSQTIRKKEIEIIKIIIETKMKAGTAKLKDPEKRIDTLKEKEVLSGIDEKKIGIEIGTIDQTDMVVIKIETEIEETKTENIEKDLDQDRMEEKIENKKDEN